MGALPSRGLRVDHAGTLRGYRGGTGVRADDLRGLAGRGRGDPRVGILGSGYDRGSDSGFGTLHATVCRGHLEK